MRKLPKDVQQSKKLKKLLVSGKNATEKKRIKIMIEYLRWKNMWEVSEWLWISHQTVVTTVEKYKKEWEKKFYKTKFKGRIESEKNKTIKEKIVKFIKKKQSEKEQVDINDIRTELNKDWEYSYNQCRWFTRRRLWLNYQKPFVTNQKQPTHAKEIAEWRLRKALYQVALEEWRVDAKCVKNKKI